MNAATEGGMFERDQELERMCAGLSREELFEVALLLEKRARIIRFWLREKPTPREPWKMPFSRN
jgi:hypothetical protein